MNREIKFRGKRVDNGEWVYGKDLIFEVIDDLEQELSIEREKLKKIEKYIEVSKEQITTKYSNEIPKEILLTHINIILNKIKGDD